MNLSSEDKAILRRAAKEIERRGVCYGTAADYVDTPYDDDNCKVCVLGALSLAVYCTPEKWDSSDPDYLTLVTRLAYELGYSRINFDEIGPDHLLELVWGWNDAIDENGEYYHTAKEAAELLRRAAG